MPDFFAAQTHLAQSVRMAAIGELASGIAHQINNPLTTIIADAQLILQMLPADHPAHESAEAIEQAGWRAQQVVQLLLEFSQPGSGQLGYFSINGAIQRALTLVGANIQSNGVSTLVELDETLPPVCGNTRQIEDLFVNLLLLARDATADGRLHTIRVRTWKEENHVGIEFHDDGKAIPPDQIDRIFEPDFFESKIGRGRGLELSICREIVRKNQGQIMAVSNPEHGTIFQVLFPVEVRA